jgi:hypothetical protein
MADWRLRLRAVLDKQFAVVVVALLVVVVLGGWLTYTAHAAPATTTETESTVSWEQTGTFDHAATVETDNSLFPVGRILENRSVYFTQLSPELDGTFRTSYDPQDSGELDQTVSLSLVIREVGQDNQGSNPTVYWETTESLATETVDGVAPRESVTVSFLQDMSAINAEINQIREEIGGSPGSLEVFVRATVDSQGIVNGETVDETATYTMPVSIGASTYHVGGTEPTVESYETTQAVPVDRSVGPLRSIGGPLLIVISLGLLGGVVVGSDRFALSETERARLVDESDRESFDDWISTIELPPEAFELPRAEAESLAGLVDVAIDTDNPVIEDPDESVYYVRHDGYLYCYHPATGVDDSRVDDESESVADSPVDGGRDDNDSVDASGGSVKNDSEAVDSDSDEL